MKRIKSIAHLLFSFRGRISPPMLWVAVVLLVVLNVWQSVWQTHEILEMKKQFRPHAKPVVALEPFKATVYIAEGVKDFHRKDCGLMDFWLAEVKKPIGLSEAKQKYDPCRVCNPPLTESEAIEQENERQFEEHRRKVWREQREFDDEIERSLRRQGVIPPY